MSILKDLVDYLAEAPPFGNTNNLYPVLFDRARDYLKHPQFLAEYHTSGGIDEWSNWVSDLFLRDPIFLRGDSNLYLIGCGVPTLNYIIQRFKTSGAMVGDQLLAVRPPAGLNFVLRDVPNAYLVEKYDVTAYLVCVAEGRDLLSHWASCLLHALRLRQVRTEHVWVAYQPARIMQKWRAIVLNKIEQQATILVLGTTALVARHLIASVPKSVRRDAEINVATLVPTAHNLILILDIKAIFWGDLMGALLQHVLPQLPNLKEIVFHANCGSLVTASDVPGTMFVPTNFFLERNSVYLLPGPVGTEAQYHPIYRGEPEPGHRVDTSAAAAAAGAGAGSNVAGANAGSNVAGAWLALPDLEHRTEPRYHGIFNIHGLQNNFANWLRSQAGRRALDRYAGLIVRYGGHASVGTVHSQDFAMRDDLARKNVESIDQEVGYIAFAILLDGRPIKFSCILQATDYLRRSNEVGNNVAINMMSAKTTAGKNLRAESFNIQAVLMSIYLSS